MAFFSKKNKRNVDQEAVLIHMFPSELPDEFWELDERLFKEIARSGTGEFDGNEVGEGTATLYAYGPDADKLFAVIGPILKEYEMCRNATVVLRKGGPGSPEREFRL